MDSTIPGDSIIEDEALQPRFLTAIWSPDSSWVGRVLCFEKAPIDIGRNEVQGDGAMSREHCRLMVRRGHAWVEVANPRNGCYLDGRPLEAGRSVTVEDGAIIRAGDTLFIVTAERPGYRFRSTSVVPGRAPAAMRADDYATRVAQTDRHALIIGPSGAGKENVARQMHALGPRASSGQLHRFDCTTLCRGAGLTSFFGVEANAFTGVDARAGFLDGTRGGTVFLDEIGDLPDEAEARFLRLIDTGMYARNGGGELHTDARFVGATLRDVRAPGAMRSDLFFRLAAEQQPILVPGLCDRLVDLVHWVEVLSDGIENAQTLSAGWVEACLLWDWPANLRGLRSQMQTARLEAGPGQPLAARGLSADVRRVRQEAREAGPPAKSQPTGPVTNDMLVTAWEKSGHSISETARLTGLSRRTVRRRLRALGLLD